MVSAGAYSQMRGAGPDRASRRRAVAPALFLLSARTSAADGVFLLHHRFARAFGEASSMVAGAFGDALGRRLRQSLVVVCSSLRHVPDNERIGAYPSCQAWPENVATEATR